MAVNIINHNKYSKHYIKTSFQVRVRYYISHTCSVRIRFGFKRIHWCFYFVGCLCIFTTLCMTAKIFIFIEIHRHFHRKSFLLQSYTVLIVTLVRNALVDFDTVICSDDLVGSNWIPLVNIINGDICQGISVSFLANISAREFCWFCWICHMVRITKSICMFMLKLNAVYFSILKRNRTRERERERQRERERKEKRDTCGTYVMN